MLDIDKTRAASVIGPLGERLTMEALPSPSNSRWTIRRKAEVLAAVEGGMLTITEACERYVLERQWWTAPYPRESQVALHEGRMFLNCIMRVPGIRMAHKPTMLWNANTQSYEV